jgi:hypothetical protein
MIVELSLEIDYSTRFIDWNDQAQDRDLWKSLVNKVMNLLDVEHIGIFLSNC